MSPARRSFSSRPRRGPRDLARCVHLLGAGRLDVHAGRGGRFTRTMRATRPPRRHRRSPSPARLPPPAAGRPRHPRDHRRRPRFRADRSPGRRPRQVRGPAHQHRLDPPRHHVPGRHRSISAQAGPVRERRGRRAGRAAHLHLLDPRPCRRRHEGQHLGRRQRRRPKTPTITAARRPPTDVQPDDNAPAYTPFDATAPAALDGHDPRHRPGDRREEDDGRQGLRAGGLDVQRHGARARSSASRSATPFAST